MSQTRSTDDLLRESVLQALADDQHTSGLDLRVGVLNAVVHLGGEAPSEGLWHLAEAIVARVVGVRGVVNRIHAPGAPSPVRTINIQLGASGRGEQ